MRPTTTRRWLRVSATLTLVALALSVWSLLWPSVVSIMIAMSVAQVLGVAAIGTFAIVLALELGLDGALRGALGLRRRGTGAEVRARRSDGP